MDELSLTELRRQFFGPTLDESFFYGVNCLTNLLCSRDYNGNPEKSSNSRKLISEADMYLSCSDTSFQSGRSSHSGATVTRNIEDCWKKEIENFTSTPSENEAKKNGFPIAAAQSNNFDSKPNNDSAQNSSTVEDYEQVIGNIKTENILKSPSNKSKVDKQALINFQEEKISQEMPNDELYVRIRRLINSSVSPKEPLTRFHSNKLSSSLEQTSKTKSFSNGSNRILEKRKKDLANSAIFETKTSPARPETRGCHTPRTSRHSTLRSLSSPLQNTSTNARRPKQIRTRLALVKVNEFDDRAKTYEVLRTDLQALDILQMKHSLDGSISASDLPPDVTTEIVFAILPDGSTVGYRGKYGER